MPELRQPISASWWVIPAAVVVIGAVYAVARWLLTGLPPLSPATGPLTPAISPPPLTPANLITARNDAIRTALAAGAGVGAAITLMLAFRRQRHQEISVLINEHDGTERRVTELYTKAVEQLGNDKAAVRLGGLYALERLAQDNPTHRQTIVNVICAYLRMPYTPVSKITPSSENASPGPWQTKETESGSNGEDREGERQVRLTAQRILTEHLRDVRPVAERAEKRPSPQFWGGMQIDLTGSYLIDFDFHMCHAAKATFLWAMFSGDTWFIGATFSGDARFIGATFSGDARFIGATFSGDAEFTGATFSDGARFHDAMFTGDAWFTEAMFSGDTWFHRAMFSGDAEFTGAMFSGDAEFNEATFSADTWFHKAMFSANTWFNEATFSANTWFYEATFSGDAEFTGATFDPANPADPTGAQVLRPGAQHAWPPAWEVILQPNGVGVLVLRRAEPPPDAAAAYSPEVPTE